MCWWVVLVDLDIKFDPTPIRTGVVYCIKQHVCGARRVQRNWLAGDVDDVSTTNSIETMSTIN